jgi:hypothetical protein
VPFILPGDPGGEITEWPEWCVSIAFLITKYSPVHCSYGVAIGGMSGNATVGGISTCAKVDGDRVGSQVPIDLPDPSHDFANITHTRHANESNIGSPVDVDRLWESAEGGEEAFQGMVNSAAQVVLQDTKEDQVLVTAPNEVIASLLLPETTSLSSNRWPILQHLETPMRSQG